MNYEEELREYIDSLEEIKERYPNYKEWAFGAVDFSHSIGLIDYKEKERLQEEYKLLEN